MTWTFRGREKGTYLALSFLTEMERRALLLRLVQHHLKVSYRRIGCGYRLYKAYSEAERQVAGIVPPLELARPPPAT